jgi:predicted nucleotidyltransferase
MKAWETANLRPAVRRVMEKISRGEHNPKIRYIVLFGSQARGDAVLTSDVDIALVSDEPLSRNERLAFASIIENENFPPYNVINTLTKNLETDKYMDVSYHIKREGLLVYAR